MIDAESEVRARASHLRLVVRDLEMEELRYDHTYDVVAGELTWPASIALVPRDNDATRRFFVGVYGQDSEDASDVIAQSTLRSGYVAALTTEFRVVLEDRCLDVECTPEQTCREGVCREAIDPLADAGPGDAGPEEGPDTGVLDDAGFDGGSPRCPDSGPCVWRSIGVGAFGACGLDVDSRIHCWGSGELLEGVPVEAGFDLLSVGLHHACAQRAGAVVCWGRNGNGQSTPPSDVGDVIALASGQATTCALVADGTIACWGFDMMSTPPSGTFNEIACGSSHSCCAIRASDASIVCWGADHEGQVSDAPAGEYHGLSVGSRLACALSDVGKVECWGCRETRGCLNDRGQVTDAPDRPGYQQVWAGTRQGCAIRSTGPPECWGSDEYGILSSSPTVRVDSLGTALNTCLCGWTEAGEDVCWGRNDFGQCSPP